MMSLLLFLSLPPLVVAIFLDWVRRAGRPPRGAPGPQDARALRRMPVERDASTPTDDVAAYLAPEQTPPSHKRSQSQPSAADR